MKSFDPQELKKIYVPASSSHKGASGKLTIVGGSHLFHGASLWSLKIASRIVDMVFYASISENNELTRNLKSELYDFIAIHRREVPEYIEESDAVLIGPGMVRTHFKVENPDETLHISQILDLKDEGEQTYHFTKYLLSNFSHKKWIIDAGALQMMNPEWLKKLNGNVVITPHKGEFEMLFSDVILNSFQDLPRKDKEMLKQVQHDMIEKIAMEFNCTILLKGEVDIISNGRQTIEVVGGNAGMTKGGTGDVLAGLIAALSCKNDLFLAAKAGSYINKKAGDELYKRVGLYFNASDLCDQIPSTMKNLIL